MAKVVDGRSTVAKAIKGDLYSQLREALTKPIGKSKKSFSQVFIEQMLSEARENPNGAIGQLLAKQLMTDGIIEKLDAETDRYLSRDIDFMKFRLFNTLYKEQRDVFVDDYRNKIVICSRRVGKTELAARLLLQDMIYPNHHALFVSLKFENAIRQCFNIVIDLAKSLGMSLIKESKAEGEIAFSNGSNILFKGNNNKAEADKLLGYKFSCCVVDEAQNQVNLMYLLDTVLRPAMTDYENSQLVLLGTPPRIPHTAVEIIWQKYKDWHHYSWDMTKNPYFNNAEEYIEGICRDKEVTKETSFIQREYYGIWSYDTEAQVFQGAKTYETEPTYPITDIVIGEDFGYSDYNSIIGLAINKYNQQGFVFFEWKQNKVGTTEIIEATKSCYDLGLDILRRNGIEPDGHIKIFGDCSDGTLLYEMRKRHGLPTYNAYKINRLEAIAKMAERLRLGQYLIPQNGILADEFLHIMYIRDEEDRVTAEIDDDIFHPESAMAMLYATRYIEELFLQDKPIEPDTRNYNTVERVVKAHDDIPDILIPKQEPNRRSTQQYFQ